MARAARSVGRVAAAWQGQLLDLLAAAHRLDREALGQLMYCTTQTLHTLTAASRSTPLSLSDHIYLRELDTETTTARVAELVGLDNQETLARQLDPLVSELISALDTSELPNTVSTGHGPVRFIDYLRANIVATTVLSQIRLGTSRPAALGEAVRALAAVLVERHPGQSIEVRVPPHVAVQVGALGDGPVHTRGTPPNVIETTPPVFLALATGHLAWDDAMGSAEVSSSGVHATEVKRMLPIWRVG